MNELSEKVKSELLLLGADLVGFGNLEELPVDVRGGLPVGISVAVKYPKDVILGIKEYPTREYFDWYNKLNESLDMLVTKGAQFLRDMGYNAVAQTRDNVGYGEGNDNTTLPHKTVATRAGIGWIGKCALLVTKEYGSAIRISSILTDAPLHTAQPVNASLCGDCLLCTKHCPAGAVSGKLWDISVYRDEFFDPVKCRKTARERAKIGFGGEDITICGKCIEVCPLCL
ncbi:MAG: epoxyqueuosine reductase [Oscillospiraceae bacterium]|nr:epoxyqueuosine reductase [Oscillospiraceae bacterium]